MTSIDKHNLPNLTPEQITLGKLYAWIHRRAQHLRHRQQTQTADPIPTDNHADSAANTTPPNRQNSERRI